MHVAKLFLKNPKTYSLYRRRGGSSLKAQGSPKGVGRREEEGLLLRFGLEGGVPSFLPTSFFFSPLIFLLAEIALLGWPVGWCATHGLLGSLSGGWAPPGEYPEPIRHSRYTVGNARNLSGDQMKPSHISIFVSRPFWKPS